MDKKQSTNDKATTCSICSAKFDDDGKEKFTRVLSLSTPCNHLFHRDCLRNWIRSNQNCCPKCHGTMKWRDVTPTEKQLTITKTLALPTSEFLVQSADAEMKQRKSQEQLQTREQQTEEENMKAIKVRLDKILETQQNRVELEEIRIYTKRRMPRHLRTVGLTPTSFYVLIFLYFYFAAVLLNSLSVYGVMTTYWRTLGLTYVAFYACLFLLLYFAPQTYHFFFEAIQQQFGRNFENRVRFWRQWLVGHQMYENDDIFDREIKDHVDKILTQMKSLGRIQPKVRWLRK